MDTASASLKKTVSLAVISMLIHQYNKQGFKPGTTHIQKAVFLLRELWHVPFSQEFCLYHYGPYSFELADDLDDLEATSVISRETKEHGTYHIALTEEGRQFLVEMRAEIEPYRGVLSSAVDALNGLPADDLVLLATTQYVLSTGEDNLDTVVDKVLKIKPKYSPDDVISAQHRLDAIYSDLQR
jgi:uncharacterized protein YwgA